MMKMKSRRSKILSVQFILTFCFLILLPLLSRAADVTLTVGKGSGLPSSTDNPVEVSLDNPGDKVGGLQLDICEGDDYLSCTGCETTERTSEFSCSTEEQQNGCRR